MLTAKKSTRVTPLVASPRAVRPSRALSSSTQNAGSFASKSPIEVPRKWEKSRVHQVGAEGHYYLTEDGRRILDVSGGAAVSCFGPGYNARIEDAMHETAKQYGGYSCSLSFTNAPTDRFIRALLDTTDGHMERAILYGSGSDAIEACIKLLFQIHSGNGQPERKVLVAREQSYHGTTVGSLAIGSYWERRKPFEDVLMNVARVSACNPYRNKKPDETDEQYVARLRAELEQTFRDNGGPGKIAGFICEPVVGAALGCMPAVKGYLQAVREVCDEYDVPLVFDEIMCGWGRTGTLHAWQHFGVVPDIQLLGKGLVGGMDILSAMLINKTMGFTKVMQKTGGFNHGHTFQGMPKTCAGALETMKMVQEQLPNIKEMGKRLSDGLKSRLAAHPNVGDIRGVGLFNGIEFVQDKVTKTAFNPDDKVSEKIHELGLSAPHNIHIYPGAGSANPNSKEGSHVILAPPFDVTADKIDYIIDSVAILIDTFFKEYVPAAL